MVAVDTGRSTEVYPALLSGLLGVLLLVAAVLGPLGLGRISLHVSGEALAQYTGGELLAVALAVAFLASIPSWLAGSPWPPALAAGACAYVIYTYLTLVVGQEYGRYPGNAEKAFFLYAAITACAVLLLVLSVRSLLAVGPVSPVPRQVTMWLLIGVGVLFALLWLGQLAGFYRNGPSEDYTTATALFWVVKYLDLGVVIPLLVVTGLLQRTPSHAADVSAVVALGFMTCMLAAVLLMALATLRQGAEGGSWGLVVVVAVVTVPAALLWGRWLAAVVGSEHG